MSKVGRLLQILKTPRKLVLLLSEHGFFHWMDDERYLKMVSKSVTGKEINLQNPKTFAEKIQWLKLHDRQEHYVDLVDKIAVKAYVKKMIGEEYIIPTLGIWETADSIQFDALPSKFVLKCNHDSGSVVICRDKETFDFTTAKKKLRKSLKKDAYYWGREWPYKFVDRKIFAETLIEYPDCPNMDLLDYKVYCFNGEPIYCQVISERTTAEKIDFYDMNWNHQPFIGLTPGVKNSERTIAKPQSFNKMIEISRVLSHDIPFSRIDFYVIDDKLFFGEITLYPNAGFGEFTPSEWNKKLGDLIKLQV